MAYCWEENQLLTIFELTDEEMKKIKTLDQDKRYWTLTLKQQEEKFLAIQLTE